MCLIAACGKISTASSVKINPALKIGDIILKVNDIYCDEIDEIKDIIKNSEVDSNLKFNIIRDNKEKQLELTLIKDKDDILKTGLYVKDQINGVGTLTYIDPKTKTFGALGHEILENTTAKKFEIKDGKIFDASVSNITKSRNGKAGEKNANYDKRDVDGNISDNDCIFDLPCLIDLPVNKEDAEPLKYSFE